MAINVDELVQRFSWIDYLVFVIMLLLSAGIGVFYFLWGLLGKKKQDTKEFLMAGKSMTTFPVAMSLIASFMSAITLLGTPSEVYQFGFLYWLVGFSYFMVMPSAAYLYFPVFYKLQVTSAYEYLERRFHRVVRWLGSATFILQMCLYMAIVVYAPALALAQVTGLNVYMSISLITFVCIFYTTLGGMKAVLWTDALQMVIMYGSVMFVIIKGCIDVGGFQYVWDKNVESGRAELINFDPNPTTRHTFWTLIVGGYFTWITIYGVNQAQVQRYMCTQTRQMAVNALWINMIGLFILMISCAFGGMVVYARYFDCDPISSGTVAKGDQLFPLFVMDTLGLWPGLPGLFVSGIFSGALSTVSSGMNSLACIVLEDFMKAGFYPNISEQNATRATKILSVFFGLLTFGLVFVAEQLGNILSAALSIFGMVGGPLLGVFTLGMFFPWANAKGAFTGLVTSLCFMFWIGIGHQVARAKGQITLEMKPVSIAGCDAFNATISDTVTTITSALTSPTPDPGEPLGIYKLSYMWYSATGCFTVIVVGLIVTMLTGKTNVRELDPRLISPGVFWFQKWIPGIKDLGADYVDEEEGLKPNQSSASLGNYNHTFNDLAEKNSKDYTPDKESSKL